MSRARLVVPETVQTSAMDCGPACLKSLLEGFGIPASYDSLRDACQTDLDGVSVDTIEQMAIEMGLEAEQIMVPVDHVLAPEANTLPALVVVRLSGGFTHFVIAWRRFGGFLQVMDPADGRQWLGSKAFAERVHLHEQVVAAGDWREWTGSAEFLGALRRRALRIRVPRRVFYKAVRAALSDPGWRSFAVLDAAVRLLTPMVESGGIERSQTIGRILEQFLGRCRSGSENPFEVIPPEYWSVVPADPQSEQLLFRGAVVLRVRGRRAGESPRQEAGQSSDAGRPMQRPAVPALGALVGFLRADGLLAPAILGSAMILAAFGVVVEALLYRIFVDLTGVLGVFQQRLVAFAMLLGFLGCLLGLEWLTSAGWFRAGRKLEIRLRTHLLHAIPRLADRYFGSRPVSDMAERCHAIHEIRGVPSLGGQLIRSVFELAITTLGIIWLAPGGMIPALACAFIAVALPVAAQPILAERDLRFRTHAGGLCRFYFDALRGLAPTRAHGAHDAILSEHEDLLVSWGRAGISLLRAAVTLENTGLLVTFALVAWLVTGELLRHRDSAAALLLVYWALNIPVLGSQIAQIAWNYPKHRNLVLRLLEPLAAAAEQEPPPVSLPRRAAAEPGVSIVFEGVSVRALGQTILDEASVNIERGSHVCIVGASGAGKSTLAGVLLGWHPASTGRILVDGLPLDGGVQEALRQETAWVDPNIQLWNRSLFANLAYGMPHGASPESLTEAIESADLLPLIGKLPQGLQTPLGEGGGLVSGGEGQWIRFGRAAMRKAARLVILDEPFTALDRDHRRSFLRRAREAWKHATLLCITHDVSESQTFDRVLVLEKGRIVEDGAPAELADRIGTRYRRMLHADLAVRERVWSSGKWRKLQMEQGQIIEDNAWEDDDRVKESLLAASAVGRSVASVESSGQTPAHIQ